ncbi:syntenin-1-like isoform X1 [Polistes fuscatus]|uniref:syntenin-1-like isoform X1 n=2 Tax=Polistes fuscatus TaxID=30207 RepID=UPI001CA81475|nr:syntenin-1-like isoform X1 [Polistes fuscatus]
MKFRFDNTGYDTSVIRICGRELYKMSLYPTLEDMKVDHMVKSQMQAESKYFTQKPFVLPEPMAPSAPAYDSSPSGPIYPSLEDYMGLDLSNKMIEKNMPEYTVSTKANMTVSTPAETSRLLNNMVAPLSGQSLGLQRAHVTNGIRELTLCKDKNGKVGLRVHSVNNGIFVCLVSQESPAALGGLRFGDQILRVNDICVAGYKMEQVHKLFRNADVNDIKVVVRDRPFERTVTMHKDSSGCIGFQFKNGKIIALVKDSSAARNGLLIDHQILEINGKNVVGLKDKQVTTEIENGGQIITVTVIPSYIYDHMVKKMSTSLLKTLMDHSVPDV